LRVYTVHDRPISGRLDPEPVLVKEGFSWPAFFFGVIWALAKGLWLTALVLAVVAVALVVGLQLVGADAPVAAAAWFAFALIVGFGGNDWRRAKLVRRGLRLSGVIAAPGLDSALRRWFDLNPAPERQAAPGAGG
jgi:hypothetical protein